MEFIRVRVGSLGSTSGSLGFAWDRSGARRCCQVHSRMRGFSRACLGVLGFNRRSRGFSRARLGIVGFIRFRIVSFGRSLLSSGLLGLAWVLSGAPRGCRVDSGLRGLTRAYLGVVGFNGRSRGFSRSRLGIVGFIRFHSGAPCCRRVY